MYSTYGYKQNRIDASRIHLFVARRLIAHWYNKKKKSVAIVHSSKKNLDLIFHFSWMSCFALEEKKKKKFTIIFANELTDSKTRETLFFLSLSFSLTTHHETG